MYGLYARQSVEKQDSISVESQLEFCRFEIKGQAFRTYIDRGFSGKDTRRPGFEALMEDIRRGEIQAVVVYKLDRISRSIVDFSNMMEVFQSYGVDVYKRQNQNTGFLNRTFQLIFISVPPYYTGSPNLIKIYPTQAVITKRRILSTILSQRFPDFSLNSAMDKRALLISAPVSYTHLLAHNISEMASKKPMGKLSLASSSSQKGQPSNDSDCVR